MEEQQEDEEKNDGWWNRRRANLGESEGEKCKKIEKGKEKDKNEIKEKALGKKAMVASLLLHLGFPNCLEFRLSNKILFLFIAVLMRDTRLIHLTLHFIPLIFC
jgi:hypothetical protein